MNDRKKNLRVEELTDEEIALIRDSSVHPEIDTGPPVGNEFPNEDENYSNPFAPTRYRR